MATPGCSWRANGHDGVEPGAHKTRAWKLVEQTGWLQEEELLCKAPVGGGLTVKQAVTESCEGRN